MKKLIFIVACLFLIGCQTNDEPAGDQDAQTEEEESQLEETEQDAGDDDADEDVIADEGDVEEPDSDDQDDNSEEPEEEPEEDQNGPEETDPGSDGYSSDDAIVLVQEYIQGTDSDIGLNYNFDGEDDQGNYRIQVFEVVDHGEGESHTATYGWYLVNPDTGEITDLFD